LGGDLFQIVADKIREFCKDTLDKKIIDLGCGDGLVGEALYSRGFSDITGMDLSEKMIAIAAAKNVYKSVQQVDLLKALPAESSSFCILSCVGTSTYLNPSVLGEWLRVVKDGGLVVFTHKTAVLGEWEEEQDRLEEEGRWKCKYKSDPLFYLPALVNPGLERVYVFVYQKL
jgi:predicted TPR repeat methyltransferase